jgi:hypothetical protein
MHVPEKGYVEHKGRTVWAPVQEQLEWEKQVSAGNLYVLSAKSNPL